MSYGECAKARCGVLKKLAASYAMRSAGMIRARHCSGTVAFTSEDVSHEGAFQRMEGYKSAERRDRCKLDVAV